MYKLFIHYLIFIVFAFSEDFINLKKNITSLLNSTYITVFNDIIVVATEGGIYSYSNAFVNHSDQLQGYNLSTIAINDNYLWIGNNKDGIIQILNKDMMTHNIIDYISIGDIYDISFSNKYAFVLAKSKYFVDEFNLIQYNNEDLDNPYYLSTILNIPNNPIDIEVLNEKLYIATNSGLKILNQLDNIILYNDWSIELENLSITKLLVHNNQLLIAYNQKIVSIDNLDNDLFEFNNQIEQLINIDNQSFAVYSNKMIYICNSITNEIIKEIEFDFNYDINSMAHNDNLFYIGLKNNGLLIYNNSTELWTHFIPNTIYKNKFDAISLTNKGDIVGVVNHKYEENIQNDDLDPSGVFIIENPLSLNEPNIKNFYSYNGYHIANYPLSKSEYNAEILNYWSGDRKIHSAVVNSNNNLFFSNSGIYPPSWIGHFENISENYNFDLSNDTQYGAVVEINISDDLSVTVKDVWNRSENRLGGQYGIFDSNATDGYMIANHIIKDYNDNIWVVNPYSEYPESYFPDELYKNWPISIKHNSGWYHLKNNDLAYIPKEIAIDNNSNLWISYLYEEDYSSSGIRLVSFGNITIENDDYWYPENLFNEQINDFNIYSIALSNLPDGKQALWMMCDLGIKGFMLNESYSGDYINIDFVPINDDYYFKNLTYLEGSKIRVDFQENIWITTADDGIRIIDNNGELLNGNMGEITKDNYGILSNIVNDIIFDKYGNVFIATDEGISILETSFVKNISSKNISVSPNPFIIGEDSQIIISNVSRNSTIKIMNLSGYVVKEFNLSNYNKNIPWNGRDENGNRLGTGVYLVTAYSSEGGIGSTKIAMINK